MTESPPVAGDALDRALAALPTGPLTEEGLRRAVAPLFARHRAALAGRIYLANHSLGRPLDAAEDDVRTGLAAWYEGMGSAWEAWMAEIAAFRARLAELLNAPRPDCVVPKASAGQGLRAVLNALPGVPRVVATRGEFDSLDVVLRDHAQRGRIELRLVEARCRRARSMLPTPRRRHRSRRRPRRRLASACSRPGRRIVGHRGDRGARAGRRRARAARRLSLAGVSPVDAVALDVDFAVRRRATSTCAAARRVLPVSSRRAHLDAGLRTLDTGWFAKEPPFEYARPDPPRYGPGGDAWLEVDAADPAVLPGARRSDVSSWTSPSRGCARIRSQLQRQLVALLATAALRRAAAPPIAARSWWSGIRRPAGSPRRLPNAASSPMPATSGGDSARTFSPATPNLHAAVDEVVALMRPLIADWRVSGTATAARPDCAAAACAPTCGTATPSARAAVRHGCAAARWSWSPAGRRTR